jgi:hypothetical protein
MAGTWPVIPARAWRSWHLTPDPIHWPAAGSLWPGWCNALPTRNWQPRVTRTLLKALLDASYNRYAFDEAPGSLPAWFAGDESKHFRPQLPVTRAEIDAIKARFRDIAARPIAKVAEARARKKRRVTVALDKAKRTAAAVLDADADQMGARSKIKAVAKAYKAAEAKKKGYSVVVTGNLSGAMTFGNLTFASSEGSSHPFVAKLSENGTFIWVARAGEVCEERWEKQRWAVVVRE